jgi:hypothetical protein
VGHAQDQDITKPPSVEQLQKELDQARAELVKALGELHKSQVEAHNLQKENSRLKEITLSVDRQRLTPLMIQYNGGDPKVDTWDWDNNRLVRAETKKPQ